MCRLTKAVSSAFPVLIAVLINGCGQVPTNISVTPAEVSLSSAGETLALNVVVQDSKGEEIAHPRLTWTTSDPGIAEVDETGKVTAKKSGAATLSVTAGMVKKDVTVKVVICSEIQLAETAVTVAAGESKVVGVTLLDESKQPLQGGLVEWKSDNEGVARVAADGTITALAAGTASITATARSVSAQLAVTVTPPAPAALRPAVETVELAVGATQKVEVQALDGQSNPMQGVAIGWSSADGSKAVVDGEGTITGVAAGETVVIASEAGGKSAQIKVVVK
ncbi:MAG: hypothetical protein FJ125_09790 [Deltaproteobacteria bacterium]|nr:hypothetical protein [Deltaproteobacteria bacterium]